MSIPYRHKRTLQRIGTVALVALSILLVAWLCWVVWLQRYVVYTSDGARLDFDVSSYEVVGEVAKNSPPVTRSLGSAPRKLTRPASTSASSWRVRNSGGPEPTICPRDIIVACRLRRDSKV